MKTQKSVFTFAIAALLVATPTMGQLINFPVLALPTGDADGVNSIGAGYARGLNDQSSKLDAIGAGFQHAREMVSFGISGGYVLSGVATVDDEVTLAGSVAYHVPIEDSPVSVSLQTGIGWINQASTALLFPVGVALQGSTEAGSMMVRPWVMPRVQFTRVGAVGAGSSSTETDFGASAGVGFVSEGGFGFGVALDLLIEEDIAVPADNASSIGFLVYVAYVLP